MADLASRYRFVTSETRVAARRAVSMKRSEFLKRADLQVRPTVALPEPDEDDGEGVATTKRRRLEETSPPIVPVHEVGALMLDRENDLWELREYDLGDSRLIWPELGYGQQDRGTVQKYVTWIRAGHEPPPARGVETEKGTVNIMDGHHRYLALQESGATTVKVWVSLAVNKMIGPNRDVAHGVSLNLERAKVALDQEELALPGALVGLAIVVTGVLVGRNGVR